MQETWLNSLYSHRKRGQKVAGWLHGQLSLRFCHKSFNSGDFFLRFFHPSRRQFKGGYTCDFHVALATRQSLKKLHHQREQKIARVLSRGFSWTFAKSFPLEHFRVLLLNGFLVEYKFHKLTLFKLTNSQTYLWKREVILALILRLLLIF